LLFALFVGWKLPSQDVRAELGLSSGVIYRVWFGLVRYVAPVGIIIILVDSLPI